MAEQVAFRNFLKIDRQLVAVGYPATSPRMMAEVSRYYIAHVRTWVPRKGRRGSGTTTAMKMLLEHALFGKWKVARGDTPVIVVMSHSLAAGRDVLRRTSMMLTDLGIAHEATADKIAIPGRGVEFRNFAPSLTSFLGITAIAIFLDELAHWRDTDSGANPSREILSRLLPTMATVPEARMLLVSSPNGFDDVHAERVGLGDNAEQVVSIIPSWEGNPTLTEEQCRRDAGDETTFLREYAAQPQETKTLRPFDRAEIDHARSPDFDRGTPCGPCVVAVDASSGHGGDDFAWLVAQWCVRADGTKVLVIVWVGLERGKWARFKTAAEVIAALAVDAKKFGAELVVVDQYEQGLTTTELPRHGLRVQVFTHSEKTKPAAVERLGFLLEQGQLALPQRNGEKLKRQLLDYQQTESRTGKKQFASRQSAPGGDDLVAALLTLMMADAAGLLEGSPNARTPKPKYVPPRAGLPLQFAADGPSGVDRVRIGPDGRAYTSDRGTYRGQFSGGGF